MQNQQQQQQQQQEEEEENWGNQYTNFKWYDVVLSVIAVLVAVLAMAVLVEAVLVMRSKSNRYHFELKVRHGAVKVLLLPQERPPLMQMKFSLAATNLITNAGASAVNISLSLSDIAVTSGNKSMDGEFMFHQEDGSISSLEPGHTRYVSSSQNSSDSSFFRELNSTGSVEIELKVYGEIGMQITPLNEGVPFEPPSGYVIFDCPGVSLTVVSKEDFISIDHGGNKDIYCSFV